MFVLKQLVKDQINYYKNRYRSEPEIIEVQEEDFMDRVCFFVRFISRTLFHHHVGAVILVPISICI